GNAKHVHRRDGDELREATRALHADPDRVPAQVPLAGATVAAVATSDVALRADPLALAEARHRAADGGDLAGELVADHHRDRDRLLRPRVPIEDVDVRAADRGLPHLDEQVV